MVPQQPMKMASTEALGYSETDVLVGELDAVGPGGWLQALAGGRAQLAVPTQGAAEPQVTPPCPVSAGPR